MAGPNQELMAIVLGGVDYGESDRIVHLLTADRGRVDALARAARRSQRRFSGGLEPCSRVRAMARPGRGELWHLESTELDDGRPHLRQDLQRLAMALYAVEFVTLLARAEHAEPRLYGLLDVMLTILDGLGAPAAPQLRIGFEAKALTFAGLAPQLGVCAACGLALDEPLAYDLSAGGAVHGRCGGGEPMTLAYVQALEAARRSPLLDLLDRPLPPGPAWIFAEHLVWHSGKELRARKVLASVE